jgi:hypothetical protein
MMMRHNRKDMTGLMLPAQSADVRRRYRVRRARGGDD